VHPNGAAASPDGGVVAPREIERFAAAQFGADHELNVREYSVVEIDGEARVIRQLAHFSASRWFIGERERQAESHTTTGFISKTGTTISMCCRA
jgi:hypothetical protein